MFHELKIDSYVHMYIFCYFRFFFTLQSCILFLVIFRLFLSYVLLPKFHVSCDSAVVLQG